ALAIVGTGFLVDTSFAEINADARQMCETTNGKWDYNTNTKSWYCILGPNGWTGNSIITCRDGEKVCTMINCKGRNCLIGSLGYDEPPNPPKGKGKNGRTIETVTAGTCADRGTCGRRAPTLGAPVNGIAVAPAGAPLNGGLNASQTAPTAATGAALNTQAATGLTGIDKSVAIPSQLSDHLSRKQR